MQVKFKKLNPLAQTPKKAYPSDAGFDLVATSKSYDDNGCVVYGTGIALEIPNGYMGLVFPRSSVSKKNLSLANCVGIIDAAYRGEVMLKFVPTNVHATRWGYISHSLFRWLFRKGTPVEIVCNFDNKEYEVGERICQLVIMPRPKVEFVESDELSDSDRGKGGFGSSGQRKFQENKEKGTMPY